MNVIYHHLYTRMEKPLFFIYFFVFLPFLGPLLRHMEVSRLGVQSELWPLAYNRASSAGSKPQSATYTTAHSSTRSLTHWARPGFEPATSWFLVGFINHWATMGTPNCLFYTVVCVCYSHPPTSLPTKVSRMITVNCFWNLWVCFCFINKCSFFIRFHI